MTRAMVCLLLSALLLSACATIDVSVDVHPDREPSGRGYLSAPGEFQGWNEPWWDDDLDALLTFVQTRLRLFSQNPLVPGLILFIAGATLGVVGWLYWQRTLI
jgi:hypothetical protein